MPDTLAQKIKAKYPGVYDDLDDVTLEAKITTKYPGVYDDLPKTGASAPDFTVENEKDAEGNAVVDPNTVGTFARHFGTQINPIPLGQMIPFPKAAGGGGWDAPIRAAKDMLHAQGAVGDRMVESYKQGDYTAAAAHALHWLLPVIGPVLDKAGLEMQEGKTAAALGDTLGLGAAIAGPELLAKMPAMTARVPGVARNSNPVEAAAVEFGQSRGIPVDAGTATGNRFVRAAQGGADATPLGSMVAERAKASQAAGLERVGGEMADQVHPSPVTPEQAGGALKSSTEDLIRMLAGQADDAYGKLRKMEADPANARMVPDQATAAAEAALSKKMAQSLRSHAPTPAELHEMRRIRAEMDDIRYVSKTFTDNPRNKGNAGQFDIAPGSAGAPVYDDILQYQPGSSMMTRGEVLKSIDDALKEGRFTNGAKGALEVARRRLAGDKAVLANASLSPDAGAVVTGKKAMLMPVDLRATKKALQPVYDRLKRESELVPMMGEKGRGLVALDRLINGPDFSPVSIVDGALSDLKGMARGASMPELRTSGQGVAAFAVKALEEQVQAAVKRSGPEAVTALEQGRTAVKSKALVADVLESIKAEPVQAYRQATGPKDTGIAHLMQLRNVAPEVLPQVGRAWLDDAIHTATAEGGFEHAAKLSADWQRMGAATKSMLFGDQVASLDKFFTLAKKLAESPNPSKSALSATSIGSGLMLGTNPVLGTIAMMGAGGLSKILRNPKALKLLTKGMEFSIGPGKFSPKLAAMGAADVLSAARAAGVPLSGVPAGAEDSAPGARRQ